MPLENGASQEAISRNIATEIRHGHPAAQAAAIAYRIARGDEIERLRSDTAAARLDAACTAMDALHRRFDAERDPDEPYGNVEYADPGYQKDGKKRYPLDSEKHIRAAWSYVHQHRDENEYTAEQVKRIEARIAAAWRKTIDRAGPPEAEKE